MNFFHFLADSFVILHEQQYSVVDCCSIRTRSIHCSRYYYYYYYSCHFGIQLNQISSSSSNSVLDPSLVYFFLILLLHTIQFNLIGFFCTTYFHSIQISFSIKQIDDVVITICFLFLFFKTFILFAKQKQNRIIQWYIGSKKRDSRQSIYHCSFFSFVCFLQFAIHFS